MPQNVQNIILPSDKSGITTQQPVWTGTTFTTPQGMQKNAADVTLWDQTGRPIGTSASPIVMSTLANILATTGQSYKAYTGVQVGTLTLNNLRFLFSNLAGSNVNLTIQAIATYTSSGSAVSVSAFFGPTVAPSTVPANGGIKNSLFIPGNGNNSSGNVQIFADTSNTAMSGGSSMGNFIIPPGKFVFKDDLYVLQPGTSIGWNIPLGGLATSEFIVYYSETPTS